MPSAGENWAIQAGPLMALLVFGGLLLAAVGYDLRQGRIPNWLVVGGAAAGILLHALLPSGFGFGSPVLPGALGWSDALKGAGLGLVLLLPLYLLRALGAGDVKMMAMVGAFLGLRGVMGAVLFSFVAGGVMALAFAASRGRFGQLVQNMWLVVVGSAIKMSTGHLPRMDDDIASVGKLPYGVAIALGAVSYVMWQQITWRN